MTTTDIRLLQIARSTRNPIIKRRLVASAGILRQAGLVDTVKNIGGKLLDVQQFMLDMAGFVPGVGEIADGVNSMYSLLRGDWFGAVMSLISMIPEAGDVVGKGGKALRFVTKLSQNPGKLQKASKFLLEHSSSIKKALTAFVEFVKSNEQTIIDYIGGLKNLGEGKVDPSSPDAIKSLAAKAAKSDKLIELAKKATPGLEEATKKVFSMVKNSGQAMKVLEAANPGKATA